MKETLTALLQKLDEKAATYSMLDKYAAGEQPLSFLSPSAREALGNRLTAVSVNVPRLLVESMAERLRILDFTGVDVWTEWLRNDLDQVAGLVHREALTLGDAYCTVWADSQGKPLASAESARQMSMLTDPGTRQTVAALKRWETDRTTEAVLYGPDTITRYRSNSPGATTTGFEVVEELPNPLGVVPVVRFKNGSRLLDDGVSEMRDVLTLTDALVKLTSDMLVASEYTARPRRFATGLELDEQDVLDAEGNPTGEVEVVNPIAESDRLMVNESPDGKFGQLPGSDLAGYETGVNIIMRQISAVSGLPEHALGIGSDNPTSADSIRASEAALTAKAEARQATFGRSWEKVARLMVAVRDGVDPTGLTAQVRWADAATRSTAQEADAVTKLFTSGLLPASTALARLGYSTDEIDAIRIARRAEAIDNFPIAGALR